MKEAVLDIIASYENRISMVEELITTAYEATVDFDESLSGLMKGRQELKTNLQGALAKNCSLRKKDFNHLIEKVLFDSERKGKEIEEWRKRVREKLRNYLGEQKKLAAYLRQQLVQIACEKTDNDSLEVVIDRIKAAYLGEGGEVFAMLRDFQWRLEVFQREQDEINRKLQRLVDRGELLSLEDLRQLNAVKASQDRKAERELRQHEVERLLSRFKERRREDGQQPR